MNSSGKECDLPTADSCAIMEGEDAEDDVMYLTKKPFFSKIRAYSREVSNPTIPRDLSSIQAKRTSCVPINFSTEDIRWIRFCATQVIVIAPAKSG